MGTVKRLVPDNISKVITVESNPNSGMIFNSNQPHSYEELKTMANEEANAGTNKDRNTSLSYGTVEEFNIDLLDQYDIEYLRKFVICLYKQVTQLTKDNKCLLDMAKHTANILQEQSKQLMELNTQLPGNKEETATTA